MFDIFFVALFSAFAWTNYSSAIDSGDLSLEVDDSASGLVSSGFTFANLIKGVSFTFSGLPSIVSFIVAGFFSLLQVLLVIELISWIRELIGLT